MYPYVYVHWKRQTSLRVSVWCGGYVRRRGRGKGLGEFLTVFILLSSYEKMLNLFNPGDGV